MCCHLVDKPHVFPLQLDVLSESLLDFCNYVCRDHYIKCLQCGEFSDNSWPLLPLVIMNRLYLWQYDKVKIVSFHFLGTILAMIQIFYLKFLHFLKMGVLTYIPRNFFCNILWICSNKKFIGITAYEETRLDKYFCQWSDLQILSNNKRAAKYEWAETVKGANVCLLHVAGVSPPTCVLHVAEGCHCSWSDFPCIIPSHIKGNNQSTYSVLYPNLVSLHFWCTKMVLFCIL